MFSYHFQCHNYLFVVDDGIVNVVTVSRAHAATMAESGEMGSFPFAAGNARLATFQAAAAGTNAGMMLGAVLFALGTQGRVD